MNAFQKCDTYILTESYTRTRTRTRIPQSSILVNDELNTNKRWSITSFLGLLQKKNYQINHIFFCSLYKHNFFFLPNSQVYPYLKYILHFGYAIVHLFCMVICSLFFPSFVLFCVFNFIFKKNQLICVLLFLNEKNNIATIYIYICIE